MKLISMADFVLEQTRSYMEDFEDLADLFCRYAMFLKKPLEPWMFVPCDEDGKVLEVNEYLKFNGKYSDLEIILRRHEKAKERCLFLNCVYDHEMEWVRSDEGENIFYVPQKESWNVESAIQCHLTLTPTALKNLGV